MQLNLWALDQTRAFFCFLGMHTSNKDQRTEFGDASFRARERAARFRSFRIQAAVVAVVVVVVALIASTVSANLEARNIRSGFEFLFAAAGFDIGEKLISFQSSDPMWKAFLAGIVNTIRVAGVSIITATLLGIIVGLMRLSKHPLVRFLGVAHVEVYRNIPLLVLLFFLYLVITELLPLPREAVAFGDMVFLSKTGLIFSVPQNEPAAWAISVGSSVAACLLFRYKARGLFSPLAYWIGMVAGFASVFLVSWIACGFAFGWDAPVKTRFSMSGGGSLTPEFLTLWLGLTLFTSAAIAEIVRAGVEAVNPRQWDAGFALGLSKIQTINYVIFPQSMRLAVPPLASQYMSLIKNSSLAVLVGYPDLVSVANTTINVTAQALEVIFIIMLVYLVLNLVTGYFMSLINRRIMEAPR